MNDDSCTCTLVHGSATADSRGTRPRAISPLTFGDRAYRGRKALDRRRRSVLPTLAHQEGCVADGKLAWEINSARDIQRHGLPDPLDLGAGLGVAGANLPATHLSGDIYDFVLNGRKLYFLLCDVSGKGLGSAMIAAHLGRVFRVARGAAGRCRRWTTNCTRRRGTPTARRNTRRESSASWRSTTGACICWRRVTSRRPSSAPVTAGGSHTAPRSCIAGEVLWGRACRLLRRPFRSAPASRCCFIQTAFPTSAVPTRPGARGSAEVG